MTDDQLIRTIQKAVKDEVKQAVKDEVRPLKEQIEIVKSKVDKLDLFQSLATNQIRAVKEQLSVVNEKLDALQEIKEIVENRIYPSVMAIEVDIKAYGDAYKINKQSLQSHR
jgi:hypothetical protein